MNDEQSKLIRMLEPAEHLLNCLPQLEEIKGLGPVLDLACGDGLNGLFLAGLGFKTHLVDRSAPSLTRALDKARDLEFFLSRSIDYNCELKDLEDGTYLPPARHYAAIMIIRYLHRPLIPLLREALLPGGIFIYESFTVDHLQYERVNNKDHLLRRGELHSFFADWEVLLSSEGFLNNPSRIMARIMARKPGQQSAK